MAPSRFARQRFIRMESVRSVTNKIIVDPQPPC